MNLAIKNQSGMLENIVVIRYFKFNGSNYLIFTKNEVDEAGYQKLYISKIVNMMGNDIVDETEWHLIRDTIKVIAKANKENTVLPVQDLNEAEINGIQIVGQKPFKLTSASVSWLGANKNIMKETVVQPSVATTVSTPNPAPVSVAIPTVEITDTVEPVASQVVNNNVSSIENAVNGQNIDSQPIAQPVSEPVQNPVSVVEQGGVQNVISSVVPNVTAAPVIPTMEPVTEPVTNPGVNLVQETPISVQTEMTPSAQNNDLFDFPVPDGGEPVAAGNVKAPINPVEQSIDYKKLYDEQTLKLNTLTAELNKYKNIVEQLKNILQ